MIIEDEELRELYKISGEEHLQNLEAGILHLEQHPDDEDKLQEVLREAHTLKGDSRMLGVKDVESLAHQIEQVVGKLREDATALQGGMSDRLYYALDAIGHIVDEAVTGEPSGVETYKVLAVLMGASLPSSKPASEPLFEPLSEPLSEPEEAALLVSNVPLPESEPEPVSESLSEPVSEPVEKVSLVPEISEISEISGVTEISELEAIAPLETPETSTTQSTTQSPKSSLDYRIESVRVATQDLDKLMTQTGELTVSKTRMAHHITTIEEIVSLWEEWNRQTHKTYNYLNIEQSVEELHALKQQHEDYLQELGKLLNQLRSRASEDVARLEEIATNLDSGIRTLRLLPLSTIFILLPRLVRDLSKQQGKQVELLIDGADTKADKRILEEMKDPLMHMIRNSIDHGIETPEERIAQGKSATATIHLQGSQMGNHIKIELSDDGRGLNIEDIKHTAIAKGLRTSEELELMTPKQIYRLIFASGFSTRQSITEVSGRGVGLDVVRANVEHLKGTIEVESTPKKGCKLTIQLSNSLATASVLLVLVQTFTYAIPVEFVYTMLLIPQDEIFAIAGQDTYVLHVLDALGTLGDRPISIVRLAELLELPIKLPIELPTQSPTQSPTISPSNHHPSENTDSENLTCIVLQVGSDFLGVIVDRLIDQQDIILKPQSQLLQRVRNVAGATILATGEVCIVLNPQDLFKSVQKKKFSLNIEPSPVAVDQPEKPQKAVLLLAEDSIATRTQEKRILESAGYEVVTAVDGLDAYTKLRKGNFDGVISDVEMPNLSGLGLAAKIREHPEYADMPIILVTSLASDEDKRRGAEAGANAYLTKGGFSQELLLETVRRLV